MYKAGLLCSSGDRKTLSKPSAIVRLSEEDRPLDDWPPRVLLGFPGSEPVLEELVQEESYRVLAQRPLRYAKLYRQMEQKGPVIFSK